MTLFVDDQEGSYKLLAPLRHIVTPSSLVQHTRLEAGDVYFTGNGPDPRYPVDIGIEYKHLGDILTCIQDGRFAGLQLPRMEKPYAYRWLLIEEEMRVDPGTGIILKRIMVLPKGRKRRVHRWVPVLCGPKKYYMYRDLMHWLTTMEVQGGVRVAMTPDIDTSAAWIAAMYWWWNDKEFDQHRSLKVFHEPPWPGLREPTDTEKVAKVFDKVGFDRARNIGRHFDSPYEFINAPLERLQAVEATRDPITKRANNDGLGKVLGRSVYDQIRRKQKRGNERRR